jgi:hypothetical protein
LRSTNASALRILFNAGRRETADRAVPRRPDGEHGEHAGSARGVPDAQVPNVEVRRVRPGLAAAADAPAPADRAAAGATPRALPGLDLLLDEWQSDSFPFRDFDRFAEALAADAPGGAFEIRLSGEARRLAPAARQVVTRCQRLAAWRNAASAGALFDRVLASHRRLHHRTQPPAVSVHAHALDTWQWLLLLDPEAGLAPQLAALFHDVERLIPETGAPGAPCSNATDTADAHAATAVTPATDAADVERRLPAGAAEAGMHGHARHGAWITDELLAELDVDLAVRVRVHRLIAGRRRPPTADGALAAEIALLDDAAALSFFSFESAAYLDDFGAEQTARRVASLLRRLRPGSRAWLSGLRLRTTVAHLVQQELARLAAPSPDGGALAAASTETAGGDAAASSVAAGPAGGRRPSRAIVIARSRLAAGMAGGAGIAPTRTAALLARAAALGALAAHPPRPRAGMPGRRPLPGAVTAPHSGGGL